MSDLRASATPGDLDQVLMTDGQADIRNETSPRIRNEPNDTTTPSRQNGAKAFYDKGLSLPIYLDNDYQQNSVGRTRSHAQYDQINLRSVANRTDFRPSLRSAAGVPLEADFETKQGKAKVDNFLSATPIKKEASMLGNNESTPSQTPYGMHNSNFLRSP